MISMLHILFICIATYGMQWLASKHQPFKFLGAAICCFVIGIAYGNIFDQNESMQQISDGIISGAVLIGISSMLIGTDFRQWISVSLKTLFAYLLGALSVLILAISCYYLFHDKIENVGAWSAMLTGAYVGGTPNMSAIQLALNIPSDDFAKAFICDAAVSSLYLIVVMTFAKPILKRFLPAFSNATAQNEKNQATTSNFQQLGIFHKIKSLFFISLLCICCAGVVIGVWLTLGNSLDNIDMAFVILGITIVSILFSFIKKIRTIPGTFEMGDYLFCLFFLVLGTKTNLHELIHLSPILFLFTCCMAFGAFMIHFLFCKLFRIDIDTFIITSAAGIMSPPFIPPVAAAIQNKKLLVPGIAVGILGLAIGNFLGVLVGKLFL